MNTQTIATGDHDSLVACALKRARELAKNLLDDSELQQMAHLAVLEAGEQAQSGSSGNAGDADEAGTLAAVGTRVAALIRSELRGMAGRRRFEVSFEDLATEAMVTNAMVSQAQPMSLVSGNVPTPTELVDHVMGFEDHPTADPALAEQAAHMIDDVIAIMPADVAQTVRLRYGLEGGDPIEPIDIADILDEDPVAIEGFLDDAERFLRHCAGPGPQRRLAQVTEAQYESYAPTGDLAWYDLRQLKMNNADLAGCEVANAVMSGMNLWGIDLSAASASGINLWGSQLDGANLQGADLRLGIFERASLCGADLTGAEMSEADLWGANLSSITGHGVNLSKADLGGSLLSGADLGQASLRGANLSGADLRRAKLMGADLTGANLSGCRVDGADLRWAKLDEADLRGANISAADIRGASIRDAVRFTKRDGSASLRSVASLPAPLPAPLRPVPQSA